MTLRTTSFFWRKTTWIMLMFQLINFVNGEPSPNTTFEDAGIPSQLYYWFGRPSVFTILVYLCIILAALMYFASDVRPWICVNFFAAALAYPLAKVIHNFLPSIFTSIHNILSSPPFSLSLSAVHIPSHLQIFYLFISCTIVLNTQWIYNGISFIIVSSFQIVTRILIFIFCARQTTAVAAPITCVYNCKGKML